LPLAQRFVSAEQATRVLPVCVRGRCRPVCYSPRPCSRAWAGCRRSRYSYRAIEVRGVLGNGAVFDCERALVEDATAQARGVLGDGAFADGERALPEKDSSDVGPCSCA